MKVTIEVTTKREVEINLPYFFKTDTGSCHAILENNTVRVWSDTISFLNYPSYNLLTDNGNAEITAEEFTMAFDARMEQIQQLKSEFFKH